MTSGKRFASPQARLEATPRPLFIHSGRTVDPANDRDEPGGVFVRDGHIVASGGAVRPEDTPSDAEVIDAGGAMIAPGLVDMQVFVGEPGAEHRETLQTASLAAAAGGITTIAVMPDTDPVIDDPAIVDFVLRRARDTSIVHVRPIAALTRGLEGREMSEIGLLQEAGAVAFGHGRKAVASSRVMRRALTYAGDFDALIVHHVEDADLAAHGVMNEGETATRLGLPGLPSAAETIMLDRDLRLVALASARYHAAALSCGDSVDAIRFAKRARLPVTCGVPIANLTLNELDIGPYRTFFKLSPPLRTEDDRQALVEALRDSTIDVIVSNHDPQDVDTKRQPFADAADGAIGLETLLSAALRLYHSDGVSLLRLIDALSTKPANLLGLECGTLAPGAPADLLLCDLDMPWVVDADALSSRSKNTAFETARLSGRVIRTIVAGRTVYDYGSG
ncbi:MAG: dihydroorotase [Pseudomonadota bacterium]